MTAPISHPLLRECGVVHGFGVRGMPEPAGCVRPRQVHGTHVVVARPEAAPEEADAIVSDVPGLPVAVVTADCVPLLLAERDGTHVAAVHAGWRGLAAGVVEAAVAALCTRGAQAARLRAVVGPHIEACCYEVDAPVVAAMRARFGEHTDAALAPSRPGHHRLALGALVAEACRRAGLAPDAVAFVPGACTRCDAVRFHSYRRDGRGAGRLLHFVAARAR